MSNRKEILISKYAELISNISVEHTEITDHIIGNSIFESFRGSHG